MSDPTGLAKDLAYLQSKYSLDPSFISGLTASPQIAQAHIQLLKTRLVTTGVLPALLGLVLLGVGIYWRSVWFGVVLGFLGVLGAYYFFASFLRQRKAIYELKKITEYHGLI